MFQSLKFLSGQSSLLLLLLLVSMSTVGCSSGPLSLLTGGGPNVAANTQVGKTNSQTLGTTTVTEQKTSSGDIKTAKVSADGSQKVVVNDTPVWLVLAFGLLCGFLIPSPQEIGRGIYSLFKKKV